LNARQKLAEAHAGMTADEIREHALALAGVVEGQDQLLRTVVETAVQLREFVDITREALLDIHTAVRNAQHLAQSRRKREARELINAIVELKVCRDRIEPFDTSAFVPAETAWPEIFSPKGTRT
jgi:hypothetical protein